MPNTNTIEELVEDIVNGVYSEEGDFFERNPFEDDFREMLNDLVTKARESERERIRIQLDSIVNAHLWGDYGLSTTEVYEGCKNFLQALQEQPKKESKCKHSWIDDRLKGTCACEECGIDYREVNL